MKRDDKKDLARLSIEQLQSHLTEAREEHNKLNIQLMMGGKRGAYPMRSIQQQKVASGEGGRVWFGNIKRTKQKIAYILGLINQKQNKRLKK